MTRRRTLRPLAAAAAFACAATTFAQVAPGTSIGAARDAFRGAHPATDFLVLGDQLARVYGQAFSTGNSPAESADRFVAEAAAIYGVNAPDLAPFGPFEAGEHLVQLMPQDDGSMKFTAVYYTQTIKGVPVFRAGLSVLCRNEPGFPAVLAGSTLWDLGDFAASFTGAPASLPASKTLTRNTFLRFKGTPQTTPASYVIWAGVDRAKAAPALAVQFEAEGTGADGEHARLLFVVDAKTGSILHEEDRILHSVGGTTKGTATIGYNADSCAAAVATPLPYIRISNGVTTTYSDASGNYSVPVGSGSFTFTLAGQWFTVQNNGATTNQVFTPSLADGATYNPVFNPANLNASDRAQVNAYLHANMIRDAVLAASPNFPTVSTQASSFNINTNIASTCNAYYTNNTINFYSAGGGCNNTAFGTVVHHEYGHNVVEKGGSGQGQYGEGMGDVHGLLIADVAVTGVGFQNCSAGIRTAANTCQFSSTGCSSCGSEIHACGQLISGCVWDLRNNLYAGDSAGYLTLPRRIVVNSVPLHGAISTIDTDIPIDYLTLDDDNGNTNDGTPHYAAIQQAFTGHGIAVPALALVAFAYPNGVPAMISPDGSTALRVAITGVSGTPDASTAKLFVKASADSGYTPIPMTALGSNLYTATFPSGTCLDTDSFYVSVNTTAGATQTDPANAPSGSYSAVVAATNTTVVSDGFETAPTGWTVGGTASGDTATNGLWVVATPRQTGWSGGSVCNPGTAGGGTKAWVTGDGTAGTTSAARTAADVDAGTTSLTSPALDCSGAAAVYLRYSRWYAGWQSNGVASTGDSLVVQASADDGATWTTVETVTTNAGAWTPKSFKLNDFITPSATTRIRFRATDASTDSTVEAGIDDFSIVKLGCTAPLVGDLDGDGHVGGSDLGALLSQWGTAGSADLNHDGTVDGIDLGLLLAAWTG